MVAFHTSVVFIGALLVLSCGSCQRSQRSDKEIAELAALGTSLNALSFDLAPILTNGSVTSIDELKREYARRYTNRPALFLTKPLTEGALRNNEYQLPPREYFMLRHWSTNDDSTTPLFWCFFDMPRPVVEYLSIDGSEHVCSSNDFYPIFAYLSNRVSCLGEAK